MTHALAPQEALPLMHGAPSPTSQAASATVASGNSATSPAAHAIAIYASECGSASSTAECGSNVLETRNARFSVKTQDGEKAIIDNVSMTVRGGEVFALMGPSGAGKTTMLELMTLELSGGKARGRVTLNGQPLTVDVFRSQAAYVEQFDSHWSFLTCREILQFAAALYMPGLRELQRERVHQTMVRLGLVECADTKAGNVFLKGMSGGQKKRLSLGLALLKEPVVLFLDEPTSGLDAASTSSVMGYLISVARESDIIVVATVHQPSTEVFMSFTRVMVLANGRVAYCGRPYDLASYCDSISRPLPPHTNPADFFLQLVNSEFVGREQVDAVVDEWAHVASKQEDPYPENYAVLPTRRPQRVFLQNLTLLHRHGLLSFRDPTVYVGRMLAFLVANSFIALLYWETRERVEENIMSIFYLGGWFVSVPSVFAVIVVFASNTEFFMIRKEIKNGMMRTGSYLLANFLLQIPYMFLLSACCVVVPSLIGNRNLKYLHSLVLVIAVMLWSFECMAQVMGVIFTNALVGMLAQVGMWFIAFLFMGTFLREENILWPLEYIASMMPLKWTTQGMCYLEYHGEIFEGTVDLPGQIPPYGCPGLPPMLCFGRTGDQVLQSLSYLYSNVVPRNIVFRNLGIVILIGASFKLIFILTVIARTKFHARRPFQPSRDDDVDSGISGSEGSEGNSGSSD